MSEYALIHTSTRVIKTVSLHPQTQYPDGHEVVEVPHLSLAGGPWVLDANNTTLTKATEAQWKEAYTTDRDRARWALRDKLATLYDASTANTRLREFLVALRDYWNLDKDVSLPNI